MVNGGVPECLTRLLDLILYRLVLLTIFFLPYNRCQRVVYSSAHDCPFLHNCKIGSGQTSSDSTQSNA